ncbi:hypothetical protein K3G63_13660 [Hymenobacter sp. HSC-4F20]|uniref:hypothetical protein n=1 Tax=Hymenobacter sp. HSC-4F20 TaxID=2864135 RepID=UPI001C72B854|nr:hypothetical protein [Hymenobacter sp. HSC-4F20]MBX0291491.1 hypothetical protein [Hymenobacter sp. HSC-4F20]
MKKLVRSLLRGGALLGPLVAQAGEREEKYTVLLVGGVGGIVAGAVLYALFMGLAAYYLRRKALVIATFGFCLLVLARMQYLSFRTLRLAAGLRQSAAPIPTPAPLSPGLQWALGGVVVFAVVVLVLAGRLWQKRYRRPG